MRQKKDKKNIIEDNTVLITNKIMTGAYSIALKLIKNIYIYTLKIKYDKIDKTL